MAILATGNEASVVELTQAQILPDRSSNALEPRGALSPAETWDNPKVNFWRLTATYWSFFLLGCNNSSYSFLIPHLESAYHIQYAIVSLLFLSPVAGFIVSTMCNHQMHFWIGQRGVALAAGACHLIAYAVACTRPPFPALVIMYMLVDLGSGAKTAAWNTFVSGLSKPDALLGFLHGFYRLGATLTPTVGSTLVVNSGWKWYQMYYLFVCMAFLDLVFSYLSFKQLSGSVYRQTSKELDNDSTNSSFQDTSDIRPAMTSHTERFQTFECLKSKIVLLVSAYLLAYVGSEVALGGWLVTFMVEARHGSLWASGIVSSGFWAGITLGRFVLGFVGARCFKNGKHASVVYLMFSIVLEILFWKIPNFLASAITVSLLGFSLGPLFPEAVVCLSKLLPRSMYLSAIGICSAIGASGASIVPFMVGAIAQARGVETLQPIVLAFLCLCLGIWCLLPGFQR